MNDHAILDQMKEWGYYLLPKSHPEALGYNELHIAIREKPTGLHFDPVTVHLRLNQDGQAEWLTVGLKSLPEQSRRVCPGCITLRDHIKEVAFFTFGGTLDVVNTLVETVYSLRSFAPILEITKDIASAHDQFAFEMEALFARFSAQWGLYSDKFEQRLAEIDDWQLYLASLDAILHEYEQNHVLRDQYHALYRALLEEKQWLIAENQYPPNRPTLEALLLPTNSS